MNDNVVLGLFVSFVLISAIASWTGPGVARRRRRCPGRASTQQREARLWDALSGKRRRWLDTDEIGLDPATVQRLCESRGWSVRRAYRASTTSWLQLVVPPGQVEVTTVARRSTRLSGSRWLLIPGFAAGILALYSLVSYVVFLAILVIVLGVGVPVLTYRAAHSRPQEMERLTRMLQEPEVRYTNRYVGTLPREVVYWFASDVGFVRIRATSFAGTFEDTYRRP